VRHATSPAVRRWRPPSGRYGRAGPLTVRTAGNGETAIVLLHGLPASGDTFGATFDALARHGQLVVPDLLGFGRSQNQEGEDFSLDAHLDALDAMAVELHLDARRLVVAGHSMGGLLAWHWAVRRANQVDAVVTWCTPLFRSRDEVRRRLNDQAPGLAWIGLPGGRRAICTQLCTRRPWLTQWLYVLTYPRVPVPLGRQLTQHTRTSYAPAMTQIVLDDRRCGGRACAPSGRPAFRSCTPMARGTSLPRQARCPNSARTRRHSAHLSTRRPTTSCRSTIPSGASSC
jgi:pimeloyl-ACP methyl ester carboxylesterase